MKYYLFLDDDPPFEKCERDNKEEAIQYFLDRLKELACLSLFEIEEIREGTKSEEELTILERKLMKSQEY